MAHLEDEPVYYISVAARLVEAHPQTLRLYERAGLIRPYRTPQGIRLYSERDIARLRQIQRLTQEMGVNLAGVELILRLLDQIAELKAKIERLEYEREHGPLRLKPAPEEPRRIEIIVEDEATSDSVAAGGEH